MNAIKRNLGWLLASQGATWGMAVVLLLVAPRKLGDDAFGQLSFAMVYVSFFELVALFGTGTYLTKVVARDTSTTGRYVFNTLALKTCLSLALIAVALGLGVVLGFSQETLLLVGVYCIGMFFNALNNALIGGLQGRQEMRWPALWDLARAYVGGALGLLVLFSGGSLVLYGLMFNLACAIPLVANAYALWPLLRRNRTVVLPLWRTILAGGVPFFIWSALLVVYGTIDIPLLEAYSGNEPVGWYTLAYRWVSMPVFFAASVATAFFPALSAQNIHIPDVFARTANRALHLVVLVATPAAIGIALLADKFIYLVYGPEFAQAIPLMRILALHIPIVGMDIVLGTVLVSADRQRQWVVVGALAAVFNPVLNLAAIPLTTSLFDNGAIGAAVVTVLTEFILMVGALHLRPAGVLDRPTARLLTRIVAASLAMVPVVLVLDDLPFLVLVAAGVVTYGVASFALRTISISELRSWMARGDGGAEAGVEAEVDIAAEVELTAVPIPGDEVASVLVVARETWPRPTASSIAHPPVGGPALPPPGAAIRPPNGSSPTSPDPVPPAHSTSAV
jgi:O-antigen/teichoic acid export membrane protein